MGRRLTDAKAWAKLHKPEILGVAGSVLGVAAFGSAIYVTHKYGSDDYREMKAKHAELVRRRNTGEVSQDEFKKLSMANIAKGSGRLAKDYAVPVVCEVGSLVLTGLAGKEYRGRVRNYAAMAASAAATVAMMQDNIRQEYGEEAVKKVMTIPKTKKLETKDEKGKKKVVEVEADDPKLMCVDQVAYEDSIKYGMPYSPTRIRIDERFSIFNACNGEFSQMLFPLHCSYETAKIQMNNDGKITVWDILNIIGLEGHASDTINRSMAEIYGIIDQPMAYNRYTKEYVKVPGFNKKGIAERKDGLELTHKTISFGDAVDAMLEDYDEVDIHDFDLNNPETDQIVYDKDANREYIYIDIQTDGDISIYRVDEQSKERKISAWEENPKSQQ